MCLHWSMCFGWDLMAGRAEYGWHPRAGLSGRDEDPTATLCFIPASLQPNRIICCFSVSLKTLCLWMWYSPCFNPDSFSSQFLLIHYAWIDFTSSQKASCMPLLDDVLVAILRDLGSSSVLGLTMQFCNYWFSCLSFSCSVSYFRTRTTTSIVYPQCQLNAAHMYVELNWFNDWISTN